MGLFSNEYKIVVGVSTQQLTKGQYTELRDAALDAIINNKNVVENITSNLVSGLKANVMKYHNYVSSNILQNNNSLWLYDENVVYKYDESTGTYLAFLYKKVKYFYYDYAKLIAIFEKETGLTDILPEIYWSDTKDYWSYMYHYYMPNFMGYNKETNEVADYPPEINALGSVKKVTWHGKNNGSYTLLGMAAMTLYFTVYFNDGTETNYTYYPLNISDWQSGDKNLLVFAYKDSTNIFRTYEIDLNRPKYSYLKAAIDANYAANHKYIPTISIRKNFINLVDSPTSEEYKHTEKALKYLGTDLKTLTDSIMSTEGGNNPNIIDDAFVGFGINIRSENKLAIRYLFDFFLLYNRISRNLGTDIWDRIDEYSAGLTTFYIEQAYTNLELFGGDLSNNYKHSIRCAGIIVSLQTGVISEIGVTTKEIILRPNRFIKDDFYIDDSSLMLYRQINATQYIQIDVRGLQFVGQTYPNAFAYYYLSDVNDDAKNHIHVPLVIGLLNQYGSFEQGELFKEGFILTIYAKDVVKIPWYLTEDFLGLIQVIAIVVSIVTFNPSGTTYYEILKQLALEAIKQILIAKLLKIGIKEAANILGYDATAILIAIALVYGVYEYTFSDVTWADDLLQLAQLAQNSFNNIVMDDLAETKFESEQFNEKYNEAMKAIEDVQSTFAPKIDEIITRRFSFYFNPNETPDMFYNRTVHAGNIGVASLDDVSTFVERKLMLPKNRDFSPE